MPINTNAESITITDADGTEYVYFHISPSNDISLGTNLEKGQPLGQPFDSTNKHFKKYGTHTHLFISESNDKYIAVHGINDEHEITESPNPYMAYAELVDLTEDCLKKVASLNEVNNT